MNVPAPAAPSGRRSSNAAIVRRVIQILFQFALQAALLLLSAGSLDWLGAQLYLGTYALFILVNIILLVPRDKGLIEERGRIRAEVKGWDKRVLVVVAIAGLLMLVVAGLDQRFDWPPPVSETLQVLATAVMLAAYALWSWAMVSNRYFSAFVRIQRDRGQTVETGGPYRYIRHPGYASSVVQAVAMPLMLGSIWALLPGVLLAVAMVARTRLEDAMLRAELDGYADYARRTRFRLMPGVW